MEVHAHTHTERKKFTHYLWEFLMLFLAVFCGFLAEYKLEHVIEHNREKEYMRSMMEDLAQDTIEINRVTRLLTESIQDLDKLLDYFEASDFSDTQTLKSIYTIHFLSVGSHLATMTQRTLAQLKNSGGLRLIRHKTIADNISLYDSKNNELEAIEKNFVDISTRAFVLGTNIFDSRFARDHPESVSGDVVLLTKDPQILRPYANHVFIDQALNRIYYDNLIEHKKLAINLITLIREKYHLK